MVTDSETALVLALHSLPLSLRRFFILDAISRIGNLVESKHCAALSLVAPSPIALKRIFTNKYYEASFADRIGARLFDEWSHALDLHERTKANPFAAVQPPPTLMTSDEPAGFPAGVVTPGLEPPLHSMMTPPSPGYDTAADEAGAGAGAGAGASAAACAGEDCGRGGASGGEGEEEPPAQASATVERMRSLRLPLKREGINVCHFSVLMCC